MYVCMYVCMYVYDNRLIVIRIALPILPQRVPLAGVRIIVT